ncbi:MAG: hypothetical protein JKX94_03670 [Sneathiella sp.]|nr:hypothetical protein [Sneathiella sp.]
MKNHIFQLNRRQALIGSGAAALAAAAGPAFAATTNMKDALRMLAGKVFYSTDQPGRWKGKEAGHSPLIKIDKNGSDILLRAATQHPMSPQHHIVKHIILDGELNFMKEQMFDLTFDMPRSRFELNGYSGRLYVVSMCNKHDNWINWADV